MQISIGLMQDTYAFRVVRSVMRQTCAPGLAQYVARAIGFAQGFCVKVLLNHYVQLICCAHRCFLDLQASASGPEWRVMRLSGTYALF